VLYDRRFSLVVLADASMTRLVFLKAAIEKAAKLEPSPKRLSVLPVGFATYGQFERLARLIPRALHDRRRIIQAHKGAEAVFQESGCQHGSIAGATSAHVVAHVQQTNGRL
jgi:hypothetical protein